MECCARPHVCVTVVLLLLSFLLTSGASYHPPDHCDDYMGYVSRNLPGATGFRKAVLLAIRSMYTDLAQQRQPRSHGGVALHPLSFSIPEELVLRTPPSKTHSVCLPYWALPAGGAAPQTRPPAASPDSDGEAAYHAQMAAALFSLTTKKAGWDCLRHLEILAAGSVPLFPNLADAPPGCLSAYPRRLLVAVLRQPGLRIQGRGYLDAFNITLDKTQLDPELYMVSVAALLSYTRNVLTTQAMAQYVLSVLRLHAVVVARPPGGETAAAAAERDEGTMEGGPLPAGRAQARRSPHRPGGKVLYVTFPVRTSHSQGDYMADTLLHGLKRLLGQRNVVDVAPRTAQYKGPGDLQLGSFLQRRNRMYGSGFTFSSRLFETPGEVDRQDVSRRLAAGEFHAVIFGQARNNNVTGAEVYRSVCRHVPPARVAAVWAGDTPPDAADVQALHAGGCVGVQFSREF